MTTYIHLLPDWPRFKWDAERLVEPLGAVRHCQGLLLGRMEAVGFPLQVEAMLTTLTEDVVKSSEIEGEHLDRESVRSSIARRLGVEDGALSKEDRAVEGVVEMMMDATERCAEPLTKERLWAWQTALFPTGRSGMSPITIGAWRDDEHGPMQVVSGPIGRRRVHFEAPSAARLDREMDGFLDWFESESGEDLVLKAALAHLWFVTIHPFDDGNGRIARAIADLMLGRSENTSRRFYSMSSQIQVERKAYYDILESTQKGGLDVTRWLEWFLRCLDRAIIDAEMALSVVFAKARFFERHETGSLNHRQRAILARLFDGFEGKLTTSKWAKLGKCSQDTALRDIEDLVRRGILVREAGGGRSTSYSLKRNVPG